MDLGIAGRTALVLGGSGGLGRAIAVALAREGVKIALGDVNAAALADSRAAVEAIGGTALPMVWDLADTAAIDQHARAVEQAFGGGARFSPASGRPTSPVA